MATKPKGFRNKKTAIKTAKGRKIGSTKWLERNLNDPFVKLSKQEGYRSRAAYKLIGIDDKFKILSKAKKIIDLGCAPGGWLQVCLERTKGRAKIVGMDLQEVNPIEGVELLVGDFTEVEVQEEITKLMGAKADLILSDMATNSTGNRDLDHLRNTHLIRSAVYFLDNNLAKGGVFIAKIIRGSKDNEILKLLRERFTSMRQYKPEASYSDSAEIYYVCIGKVI